MSETITSIQWKLGKDKILHVQDSLIKLHEILALIAQAENKHRNLISYSQSEICNDGSFSAPQLKRGAIKDAESAKSAAIRLQKYFTNILNDLSL
ncbi:MAG: hypothetical protein ACEQSL_01585 [Sediminibacterium sp.]